MGHKPVIGLLGGVGSGKSTAAAEFVRLGCALIDADAIGHEVLRDPAAQAEIRAAFGDGILDPGGRIDRQALAEAAFSDPAGLARLNAISHPRIRRRMEAQIRALQADPDVPAIVLDAALLRETDWHELCTTFVFVDAPADVRARRVAQARGWSGSEWRRREKSQKPLDIKASSADHVIQNSSGLSHLREGIREVFCRIVH